MEWDLAADFPILCAIEEALGASIITLAGRVTAGAVTLEEMAAIISLCSNIPLEKVGEMLVQGGLSDALQAVAGLFLQVLGEGNVSRITRAELETMRERFPDQCGATFLDSTLM